MPILMFLGVVFLLLVVVCVYFVEIGAAVFFLFLAYIMLRCQRTVTDLQSSDDDDNS